LIEGTEEKTSLDREGPDGIQGYANFSTSTQILIAPADQKRKGKL